MGEIPGNRRKTLEEVSGDVQVIFERRQAKVGEVSGDVSDTQEVHGESGISSHHLSQHLLSIPDISRIPPERHLISLKKLPVILDVSRPSPDFSLISLEIVGGGGDVESCPATPEIDQGGR